MTKTKSNYVNFYIPPRHRAEFDEQMEKVIKATGRKRNEIVREFVTKCLQNLDLQQPRKPITVEFNL